MIYYRIAFCVDPVAEQERQRMTSDVTWKWRSTLLTSPHALFTLLRAYYYMPQEQVRVFFASSSSEMDEMLDRQNSGLRSNSLTSDQFLSRERTTMEDIRRLTLELNTEKDHDLPYYFSLPTYLPELLGWLQLQRKVRCGDLEP